MSKTLTRSVSQNKMMSTKLVMGLMVAAVSVLVGTSNIANAMPGGTANSHASAAGKYHSQVKGAAGQGYGYGSGNINVGVGGVNGDGNVITIIINYFVGH